MAHYEKRSVPRFYTVDEIANRLVVSERTVRRWVDDGLLIAHTIGGVVRVAESDLVAFLKAHRNG
jgi:excisionase family DNA binding protein